MFAQKHTARELAEKAEVPILAGSPLLSSGEEALEYAKKVGLPVLLKATGGQARLLRQATSPIKSTQPVQSLGVHLVDVDACVMC
jgi:urea carboxylase